MNLLFSVRISAVLVCREIWAASQISCSADTMFSDSRHVRVQPSLRDSCNREKTPHPTLKGWAILESSLRDEDQIFQIYQILVALDLYLGGVGLVSWWRWTCILVALDLYLGGVGLVSW